MRAFVFRPRAATSPPGTDSPFTRMPHALASATCSSSVSDMNCSMVICCADPLLISLRIAWRYAMLAALTGR